MISIAVQNLSTVCTDDEVKGIVAAVQKQITHDFYPAWGVNARLRFVAKNAKMPSGAWQIAVLDTSDQADALGYHDITAEGLPLGKVFAKSDKDSGYKVSVTFSHEALEMLGDPDINLCAEVDNNGSGRLYAYEMCDPVEADKLGYDIDGVTVSDFVLPAYFESFRTSGPFAFKTSLPGPFTLAAGGYLGYLDFNSGKGWQQQFASSGKMSNQDRVQARPRVGSRRERRRTARANWVRSTVAVGAPIEDDKD